MRNIIIIFFLIGYLLISYIWLSLGGENSLLGPGLSLLVSIMKPLDIYIISGIIEFIGGIIFYMGCILFLSIFKLRPINPSIPVLWCVIFPLFILLGIFLFQIGIINNRFDIMYLIVICCVFISVLSYIFYRGNNEYKRIYIFVAIAYIICFIGIFLPTDLKRTLSKSQYSIQNYKIPDIGMFVNIVSHHDTISVKIGRDLGNQDNDHTLSFQYIDNPNENMMINIYKHKILFLSDIIRITSYGDYKRVNLDEVLYENTDIEYIIANNKIYARKRCNNNMINLQVEDIDK